MAIILSLVGLLQAVGGSVGPVFLATGEVRTLALWGVVSSTVVVIAFLIGLPWGIVGVATAYLVASLLLIYPSFRIALPPVGLQASAIVEVSWRSLVTAVVMATLVVAVGAGLGGRLPDLAVLIVQVAVGITIYGALSLIANREQTRLVLTQLIGA